MSEQTSDDGEYMLLRPDVETIAVFLRSLEARGIDVETAVVEMPSEASSGSLSVQFRGEPDRGPIDADQEGQR